MSHAHQLLTDQFGDNFRQLNEAVGALLDWQAHYREQLAEMIDQQGRAAKNMEVATSRYEEVVGKFSIQRIRSEVVIKSDEALNVCQQCLDEIKYRSFSLRMTEMQRSTAVRDFSLKDFFEEFGKSCIWAVPKFDAVHSPANIYSAQFHKIAKSLKQKRGYRCEEANCRIDLSHPTNQRFLHAHHIDADKSDNHSSNIKLVCIRCHAEEFQHAHMRGSPDYALFCTKFPKTSS